MKRRVNVLTVLAMLLTAVLPITAFAAADFVPNPQTAYATQFIQKCEGQQWLLNETERLLNTEQKSINAIESAADLDNITSIGLADKGISGSIPAAIGEFHQLRGLYLSGNSLSGNIPSELFALTELSNIDLSENQYSGAIPAGFGSMTGLKTLVLKGNAFSGTIPDTILANTTLAFFDVSSNQLTGTVPSGLNRMTGLAYLAIANNPWAIGAMPDLSALTALKSLSAWGCNFTGPIPDSLYALTSLQVLDLADNSFSGELSANIGNLVNLQLLSVGSNQIGGTVPPEIANLTKLISLDISNNELRGALPVSVSAITTVYAQNNYLTGTVLNGLANNERNFCDGASTAQYQLTANTAITISKTSTTNLYSYLKDRLLMTGDTSEKALLPADCYIAAVSNDTNGKIALTADANGIYVQANDDISTSENILATIHIKDNAGSGYSKVSIVLTTESTGGGGIGGTGGSGPSTPSTVTHDPYVTGYPDGTFGPERNISREEVTAMLARVLEYELAAQEAPPFPDVATDRWSAPYVAAAKKKEILQGYNDGSFGPSNPMTRAELATCLVRIAESRGMTLSNTAIDFTDVERDAWYSAFIEKAAQYGLIAGYSDGTFRPNNTITRAEAVTMINRMLGRNPETAAELPSLTCPFRDVSSSHWAYLQIMEAAVKHEH